MSSAGGGASTPHDDTVAVSDAAAFDAFFVRNEQPLTAYLRRMLVSDETAGDVAQEAFFRAWQHFEMVSRYDRPDAWLFRVATNLALSVLRRRAALSFTQLSHRGHDARAPHGVDELELLASPEDVEGDAADRDLIERLLRTLPERQRAALLLRAVHGFSVQEIAAILELSAGNVYQLLSRGARHFRALYAAAQDDAAPQNAGRTWSAP